MEQMNRLALVLLLFAGSALAQPSPPKGGKGGASEGLSKDEQATQLTIENSLSIRDPFRRPISDQIADLSTIPELERFDLDKMKLVGVITGPRKPKAMITLPSGKMLIVDETTRIGTRHGIIRKILPGMISVEEKVVNLLGQEESVETVLEYAAEKPKTTK